MPHGLCSEPTQEELQSKFKIAVSGLVDKHWGVRVLDLFSHWAPKDILQKAETIPPIEARTQILAKFITTAGITTEQEILRLFSWPPGSVHIVLEKLIQTKTIHRVKYSKEQIPSYTVL